MDRILVIRFSSMGDVLLTAPILCGALNSNPDLEIDLVTKKQFSGYFKGIDRLQLIETDTKGEHKGLRGIWKLYKDIRIKHKYTTVIDLHSVLRSRILCFLFQIRGVRVFSIDKGRKEKRQYLNGRIKKELKHTVERYQDVFTKAGIHLDPVKHPFMPSGNTEAAPGEKMQIGLAPFARHEAKKWPMAYMIALMNRLSSDLKLTFHFYGGRDDFEKLKDIDFDKNDVLVHAGKLNPGEEISSIAELDLFISMDSANMHLADLIGIPVISIWGGTHPDLGFRPFSQDPANAVQSPEDLPCRPCSVYGNRACSLKESKFKCLRSISPEQVVKKILESFSL